MKQVLYFSGLNGLRAIAALAVLFSHTTIALNQFGLNSFIFGKYSDGNPKATLLAGFGVSIFFTLSGFLITYLLLEEKKEKEINIKFFYIRRILRIWPLYYLYLLLSILTSIIFDMPFGIKSFLLYFFLLANVPYIFGGVIRFLGHYWSLGVEEQFYSFWPWVIKKSNSILKVTTIICLSLILLKFGLRTIDICWFQGKMNWPYEIVNVTRFHCMLIGAIGAILYFKRSNIFILITNSIVAQSVSWFIILLIAINKFHIISFLDNEFVSVITVFLIMGQIQKTHRIINLDIPILNFIGKISYGIYVIHPLLIFYLSKMIKLSNEIDFFSYVIVYFFVFSSTIILAYLSYEFFEKRFLVLKEKYSTLKTHR